MAETSVAALSAELRQLESNRPEMPRGLDAEHPLFVAWHHAFQHHVDRKVRILAKLSAAMCPLDLRTRQDRPLAALPRLPSRIRQ